MQVPTINNLFIYTTYAWNWILWGKKRI